MNNDTGWSIVGLVVVVGVCVLVATRCQPEPEPPPATAPAESTEPTMPVVAAIITDPKGRILVIDEFDQAHTFVLGMNDGKPCLSTVPESKDEATESDLSWFEAPELKEIRAGANMALIVDRVGRVVLFRDSDYPRVLVKGADGTPLWKMLHLADSSKSSPWLDQPIGHIAAEVGEK